MKSSFFLQKIFSFFFTKIIIGIVVVAGSVAFTEWAGRLLLDRTQMTDELKNAIIGIADAAIALLSYVLLFTFYEKRKIKELSVASFPKNALTGFSSGLILQSLLILVIYIFGSYSILRINPVSFLLPAFTAAFTAGFVAEIILTGIIFRLTEERLGTFIAIIILVLLFTIVHANSKGATFLSVLSTTMQAGFLLSATYIFSRSLWFPIFFHFAWDFAEPGIFGGINPGITINQSLINSKIDGHTLITGGQFGPGNSVQSVIICLITGFIFLWLARQKNNFIQPYWKK